jgi:ketosteroid isomerase-like protein
MQDSPLSAIRQLTKAWLKKDEAAMSRWQEDDITEIGPAFETALRGKRQIFRHYREYLDGTSVIELYKITRPRTVYLSGSIALVYFNYWMETRKGNRLRKSRGKESIVVVKAARGWRVRFVHWHEDPRPAFR